MDKVDLLNFVIKRKQVGDSFQAISDLLYRQYGIRKDRQSLHGIYTRHMKKMSELEEKEDDAFVFISTYIRCDEVMQACSYLKKMNYKIEVGNLHTFIRENKVEVKKMEGELKEDIYRRIRVGETVGEIKDSLNYRGIECSEDRFKDLMAQTFVMIAEKEVEDVITYCLEVTYDPDIMNRLKDSLGVS